MVEIRQIGNNYQVNGKLIKTGKDEKTFQEQGVSDEELRALADHLCAKNKGILIQSSVSFKTL